MGCNNSKNITAPVVVSDANLGSEGSSHDDDEDQFIRKRTWGSPAPPLPDIGKRSEQPLHTDRESPVINKRGGTAFFIQDENSNCNSRPPRRLQTIKNVKGLSREALMSKQREHEEKRLQKLRETTTKLSQRNKSTSNIKINEFDRVQRLFVESEKRVSKVSRKREEVLQAKVEKVREHNRKVRKRTTSLKDSATDNNLNLSGKMEHDSDYNKSESESWADNDSVKNIYDQMDYITPASGLASAVDKKQPGTQSDEEFFS